MTRSLLGWCPVATRNEIQQSRDLQEIFCVQLAFEAKAVEMYSKAIELAGDNKPLVVFRMTFYEEQEGVDEYTKLLRSSGSSVATTPVSNRKPIVGLSDHLQIPGFQPNGTGSTKWLFPAVCPLHVHLDSIANTIAQIPRV